MGRRFGIGLRILVIVAVVGGWNHNGVVAQDAGRIRPYEKNPRYWQYKSQPLLLLGGTDDDNLFQWTGSRLTGQLDLLKSIGGNYIRCTMSARDDGNVRPFAQVDGKYDLNQWNDEYWNRFERLLKLTRDRDIIVQIEVWAFHDFNAGKWEKSPWRPANNVNYTLSNTTLKDSHGNIGRTAHDFFFTVPKLADDRVVLRLQQSFVDKMLSYTLRYGHVLYCMTNEIHPQYSPEWGWYWSSYAKEKAAAADTRVETTEMYWEIDLKKPQQRASLDRPEVLSFFEASQNSAKMGQENWNNLRFAYDYLAKRPRPINHVKIYGADSSTWKGSTDRHATECFWRNIIGGSASSRFHRPPYGLGLGKKAQTHIRSMRMLTDGMDLFTCAPHNELLSDREPNEAYCLADPGKRYAVYFPNGGEAVLDIGLLKEPATIRWLEISTSKWGKRQELKPARSVTLRSPESGPWVALLAEGTVLSRSSDEYVTEVKRVAFGGCGAERFVVCLRANAGDAKDEVENTNRIRPYAGNPRYWQYEGQPVLLLGGSDDDNLFQSTGSRLTEQLDLLKSVGGNYLRCTMSGRDEGNVWPFKQVKGKYSLEQWDEEYWRRFENFLKATCKRDIIVQVEIWATYDFYREFWLRHPFNPKNNINYTAEQTGLSEVVDHRPGRCENVFFQSVPEVRDRNTVLKYQRRFVDKVLSYSLKFGHVLYCMDNETSATPQWGKYWSEYVKAKAKEAGVVVETTEMWYDHFDKDPPIPHATFDDPKTYSFVDVSQNSHKRGQSHWNSLRLQLSRVDDNVRPLTNVKIYGADTGPERWFRADVDGVERFWRNIFGGMASARFHRPPYGLGLGEKAQANIKSMRMITDEMDIFTCVARNDLLSNRRANGAYATANPGREYAVYFPNGQSVGIDLRAAKGAFSARWLDIARSRWAREETLDGGTTVTLTPPGKGHWAVLIRR